jgi:hypothetical protein
MTIRYRTAGAWGPGEGTNLTAAQVDENFYTVDQKIDSEIAALPEPNCIANIVQDGTQITIILDDATEEGPFTLPQANFRPAITDDEDVPTDGTYELVSGDANHYKRFAAGVTVVVASGIGMAVDSEIYFRQAGADPIEFDAGTGVTINVPDGFLAQTAVRHGTVVLKCVAEDEYDLEGRLAEDVTA